MRGAGLRLAAMAAAAPQQRTGRSDERLICITTPTLCASEAILHRDLFFIIEYYCLYLYSLGKQRSPAAPHRPRSIALHLAVLHPIFKDNANAERLFSSRLHICNSYCCAALEPPIRQVHTSIPHLNSSHYPKAIWSTCCRQRPGSDDDWTRAERPASCAECARKRSSSPGSYHDARHRCNQQR